MAWSAKAQREMDFMEKAPPPPNPTVGKVEYLSLDTYTGEKDDPRLRAFRAFHDANPHIYRLFIEFAFQANGRGRERFSARTILHRIRWYTAIDTAGDDFKVNNNWSPFYARLAERDYPQLRGFFEHRRAVADEEDAA